MEEWLKLVLDYQSYPKNKTGYPFFLEHPVGVSVFVYLCLCLCMCVSLFVCVVQVLYENMLTELPFASFFLSKLLSSHKGDVDIHHLASLDPEMYR